MVVRFGCVVKSHHNHCICEMLTHGNCRMALGWGVTYDTALKSVWNHKTLTMPIKKSISRLVHATISKPFAFSQAFSSAVFIFHRLCFRIIRFYFFFSLRKPFLVNAIYGRQKWRVADMDGKNTATACCWKDLAKIFTSNIFFFLSRNRQKTFTYSMEWHEQWIFIERVNIQFTVVNSAEAHEKKRFSKVTENVLPMLSLFFAMNKFPFAFFCYFCEY